MSQSQKTMKSNRIIYLGEVLSHLDNLSCSVPATLIGGIVDRGFSQNDIDVLVKPNTYSHARLKEALPADLARLVHLVEESEIGREALPPRLQIGGPRLWDHAQKEPFYSDSFMNYSTRICLHRLPIAGKHILDVGCGDGYALSYMVSLKGYPIGISPSQENIEGLRRHGYEVYLMDQNCLDFPDQTFDIVFSHHTLEHSIAPVLALAEAYRVLTINGIFDLTVGISQHPDHVYIFNKEFLETLVQRAGFTVRESETRRPGLTREIHINAIKQQGGLI